ncbi:MAG: TolC family outer membrane protein [Rickettsiales bacterium]
MLRQLFTVLSLSTFLAAPAFAAEDTFKQALVATYTENPRIKAERQRQESSDEEVAQAVSGFRPTAVANYDRGRQRTDFGGAGWSYGKAEDKSLRVEQPLFRGFGTISSYRAAKQRVQAGQAQLMAVEQAIMQQAITAYMDVVANQSLLELSRNNKDVLEKQLQASKERFDVGEVTRTDVAQSEARLSQARTDVISAEGRLISAIAAFERVVGYKPEGSLSVPKHAPELPASLKEALAAARDANPQLLSAIRTYKAADQDVWTNTSTLLPRVSLVGSMSKQKGAGVLGSSTFDQDKLTVNVQIPLYQSGAEYSRVREAKAIARQQKHTAMDTELSVEESVTRAWEALETSIATIAEREDQIKAAEIALDGVKQEQEYGARTVLDVLDAEQELFTARTNLVRAERDKTVATYNLLVTMGALSPEALELDVASYDPNENYDAIKWQPIGF